MLRKVQSKSFEAPTWVDVPLGDVTMTVASDALKASPDGTSPPIRLPVTWPETVAIARSLGDSLGQDLIAPSQRLVDAIHAAATIRTYFPSQGTVGMRAVATAKAYNRDVDQQLASVVALGRGKIGDLVSGHEKYWILHPRLDQAVNDAVLQQFHLPLTGPDPAVNYGAWDSKGKLIQTVGGRHNCTHYDESQLYRPIKRWAKRGDGTPVDLLQWMESNDGVPTKFTDLFRTAPAT